MSIFISSSFSVVSSCWLLVATEATAVDDAVAAATCCRANFKQSCSRIHTSTYHNPSFFIIYSTFLKNCHILILCREVELAIFEMWVNYVWDFVKIIRTWPSLLPCHYYCYFLAMLQVRDSISLSLRRVWSFGQKEYAWKAVFCYRVFVLFPRSRLFFCELAGTRRLWRLDHQ